MHFSYFVAVARKVSAPTPKEASQKPCQPKPAAKTVQVKN